MTVIDSEEPTERLQAEFLAMVSHELRTPLTSIKGSTATLLGALSTLDPAEVRQLVRIVDVQADRLRELINELLDVARIESGTLPLSPEPVEVVTLVDEARNTFLIGHDRRDIQIDMPLGLPKAMADSRRIVQVLTNLLANAAKYSQPSSEIRLTVRQDESNLVFSVADQGQGVSADRLPQLFGKCSPADEQSGEREVVGSALGLTICKGIIEGHGGRIWAESEGLGRGARFSFTLLAARASSEPAGLERSELSPPRIDLQRRQTRILVVDDDPQLLRQVRDMLSDSGYAPTVTADPDDVNHLMRAERPHLVLLDLLLPGADGIELMQTIKNIADVPVIFLSGYGRDEVIARALELGATDYVVKPFSPTELVARIGAALRRHQARADELPEPFELRNLQIDFVERRVTLDQDPVSLTATEYRVLIELALSAGRVLTHDQLLQRCWRQPSSGDRRLVRSLVKRLRHKLGDDANDPQFILTEPGVGYRIPKPEGVEQPAG